MIVASSDSWTNQSGVWTVVATEGTLIKLRNPYSKDLTLNTASWHFVSAELAP